MVVFTVSDDLDIREPLQWTNTYVSLHCAVLATVWSSIGDATATKEKEDKNVIRRKSSSAFIQLERDKVKKRGEHLSAIQPRSTDASIRQKTLSKRSASPFCEGDCIDIMPNSYQLDELHSKSHSNFVEAPTHKMDYHANVQAGYDAIREMKATRQLQSRLNDDSV